MPSHTAPATSAIKNGLINRIIECGDELAFQLVTGPISSQDREHNGLLRQRYHELVARYEDRCPGTSGEDDGWEMPSAPSDDDDDDDEEEEEDYSQMPALEEVGSRRRPGADAVAIAAVMREMLESNRRMEEVQIRRLEMEERHEVARAEREAERGRVEREGRERVLEEICGAVQGVCGTARVVAYLLMTGEEPPDAGYGQGT